MKILCINCKPDLSYFDKRGLSFEVEYATVNEIFPLRFLYNAKNEAGVLVPLCTPWVEDYLEKNYKDFKYSIILVGWKPSDYNDTVKNTGGYAYFNPLKSGTRWATVRQDPIPNNNYPVHEIHHILSAIINTNGTGHHVIDYMDATPVNGVMMPYYKNEQPEAKDSNYAVTWNQIKPFLSDLQGITYNTNPVVKLTRLYDWQGKQTVGKLEFGTWSCNTLELGWKDNQKNISCIPKGIYTCKWVYTLKFGWCYEVQNVPNRTGILFHEGNYFFNTLGCIMVGKKYGDLNNDKLPDLLNSVETRKEFQLLMAKKDFTLQIT